MGLTPTYQLPYPGTMHVYNRWIAVQPVRVS
jgi:hypothetical protein